MTSRTNKSSGNRASQAAGIGNPSTVATTAAVSLNVKPSSRAERFTSMLKYGFRIEQYQQHPTFRTQTTVAKTL
ncbi:hypothetical protein M3650_29525 [Paenibacillus sp. MER TA 81-3]|nr:hypothetical protein [Paenibacillus sp. MER TA 81-3]